MRNKLLKELSSVQFALHELYLYLDTHPCDRKAIAAAEELEKQVKVLIKSYEQNYGPLTVQIDSGDADFNWVNAPWPWEKEAN